MDTALRVTQEELVRDPQRVFDAARRDGAVVVEERGEDRAALLDIVDYRLLRAAARARSAPDTAGEPAAVPTAEALEALTDVQERFELVLASYLAERISLSRAAELLGLGSVDLRFRFHQLGIPLRLGPSTVEEALTEINVAESIGQQSRA